jgi:hypothetical protein
VAGGQWLSAGPFYSFLVSFYYKIKIQIKKFQLLCRIDIRIQLELLLEMFEACLRRLPSIKLPPTREEFEDYDLDGSVKDGGVTGQERVILDTPPIVRFF